MAGQWKETGSGQNGLKIVTFYILTKHKLGWFLLSSIPPFHEFQKLSTHVINSFIYLDNPSLISKIFQYYSHIQAEVAWPDRAAGGAGAAVWHPQGHQHHQHRHWPGGHGRAAPALILLRGPCQCYEQECLSVCLNGSFFIAIHSLINWIGNIIKITLWALTTMTFQITLK